MGKTTDSLKQFAQNYKKLYLNLNVLLFY